MQTDTTIALFEQVTAQLGDALREFVSVVDSVDTVELQKEADRRMRAAAKKREQAKARAQAGNTPSATSTPPNFRIVQPAPPPPAPPAATVRAGGPSSKSRRPKKLNISTVKFHSLGHYPPNIRSFGPTDLYSTEWVSFVDRPSRRRTSILTINREKPSIDRRKRGSNSHPRNTSGRRSRCTNTGGCASSERSFDY